MLMLIIVMLLFIIGFLLISIGFVIGCASLVPLDKVWLLTCIVMIIVGGGCAYGADCLNEHTREVMPICSLSNDKYITGDFVIGCGYIDTDQVYIVMEVCNADYTYKQHVIQNDNVFLIEDAPDGKGYVVWKDRAVTGNGYNGASRVDIHVPDGTIVREFKITGRSE